MWRVLLAAAVVLLGGCGEDRRDPQVSVPPPPATTPAASPKQETAEQVEARLLRGKILGEHPVAVRCRSKNERQWMCVADMPRGSSLGQASAEVLVRKR